MRVKRRVSTRLSPEEFYERRNKVLVVRSSRGLGDILAHRMIFDDFKRVMPDSHIVFACQRNYIPAMSGHPSVDEVVDCKTVDPSDFLISYDTSQCCIRYESASAPRVDKARPDIWSEHCGVELTGHDMHVPFLSRERLEEGEARVNKLKGIFGYPRDARKVMLCPIAFEVMRSLTEDQIRGTVAYLRRRGLFIYSAHTEEIAVLRGLGVPVLYGFGLYDWMSFIHAADYVISVDTAAFHYAGGIGKPLTGIFTYADGKLRGKYYDFVLVQRHRDEGDWDCGPCFIWTHCSHAKCGSRGAVFEPKPCLTELSVEEITQGAEKMLQKRTGETT